MGAINYGTSDYITMGIKPESTWDYEHDPAIMEEMKEYAEEYDCSIDEAIEQNIETNAEADYENAKFILNQHSFYYYHITLNPGYYEGFYIDIENNFPVALDSWEDRKDMLKEIREIESMLKELAGCGIVSCYPGWCTGYADYKQTLKDIKAACKEMREEARTIPTWRQYTTATT